MTDWGTIIADEEFQALPVSAQAVVRQQWVDATIVPELQGIGIDDAEINFQRTKAINEFDNGQGMVSSLVGSTVRGIAGMGTSAVQGVGVLTGDFGTEQAGRDMASAVDDFAGANPSRTNTNLVGSALGNAAGFFATAGAGGLVGKGLGAASLGAETAGLGIGFLGGVGSGAQEADQYGITGGDRMAKALASGVTEVLTEKIPFGLGSEMKALRRIPGLSELGAKRAGGILSSAATEGAEEGISQIAGNYVTQQLAPDGVQTPDLTSGLGQAMAGGAIAGVGFGLLGAGPHTTHRTSDVVSQGAIEAANAAGDTGAASVLEQVQAGARLIPVPLPTMEDTPAGDNTLTDLFQPADATNDLVTYEDLAAIPVQPVEQAAPDVIAPVIEPIPPMESANPVEPSVTPMGEPVDPVDGQPAVEDFAVEPTLTPEQEIDQRRFEASLIDTQGRIPEQEAVKIFNALKDLGATSAKLVINENGSPDPNVPVTEIRGQRVMIDGQDTIFLNRSQVRADTPLHEIGHGFIPEMRTSAPQLYEEGRALVQGAAKPLMEAIRARYTRRGKNLSDEDLIHETLTTLNGNENAKFWQQYVRNPQFIQQIQQWIAKFRTWIDDHLRSKGIDPNVTVGEFAKKVNRRVLAGKMRTAEVGGQAQQPMSGKSRLSINDPAQGYTFPEEQSTRQSGLAANQPGSPVRELARNYTYQGEAALPAFDQARAVYDQGTADGATFADRLATFDDMVVNSGSRFYNMSPGAYFGVFAADLTRIQNNPDSAPSDIEEATRTLDKLMSRVAAAAAAGGQFIKGFDLGLKLANNPAMVVKKWDDLAPFDGSERRRKKFDDERDAAVVALNDLQKEVINDAEETTLEEEIGQNLNALDRAETASDEGAVVMEEALTPEIDALEAEAATIEAEEAPVEPSGAPAPSQKKSWVRRAYDQFQTTLLPDANELIAKLRAWSFLSGTNSEGEFSITGETPEPGPILAAMDAEGLTSRQQMERLQKEIKTLQAKMAAAAPDDLKTMVVERINKNLNRLLNGKAKKKPKKITQNQIASAITTALMSKAGYAGVPIQGGDMSVALGVLLANQDVAAAAVDDVHNVLEGDQTSAGMITKEKLKAFMELMVGKSFDPNGVSTPYGERQIAAVLRSEMKKLGVNLTKIVTDESMLRSTADKLEAQLRNPARLLAKTLTPESLDRTVAAVLTQYNKTAKQRAHEVQARKDKAESDKAVREAAKESKTKRAENYRQQKKKRQGEIRNLNEAISKMTPGAPRDAKVAQRDGLLTAEQRADMAERQQAAQDAAEERRTLAEAAKDSRSKRQDMVDMRRRARRDARRAIAKEKGLPEPLDYDETQTLMSKPGEKIIAYIAKEFGFDLKDVTGQFREDVRKRGAEETAMRLADALGLSKANADKFVSNVTAAAMRKMDDRRRKSAVNRVRTAIEAKNRRLLKTNKKQPTEAQRLVRLVETGGMNVENVEQVMLNSLGAKKFSPEFKDHLTKLVEKSNDPDLPQSTRDQYTAAFLGEIRSARGVSAIGLLGEWTMANIFFAVNTFKVNFFWGGVKAIADSAVFLATAPTTVTVDGEKVKITGARKALLRQMLRGYSSAMRSHTNYMLSTGKSNMQSNIATDFQTSDFETLAAFHDTEIRAWMNGKPLSPAWAKRVRTLTSAHKYVRRIMVATDILHRTPAIEMLKAMAVIRVTAEKGGTLPNTSAAWEQAIDDAMYGGDFKKAVADARAQAETDFADGKIGEAEKSIRVNEILDNMLAENLGVPDDQAAKMLAEAQETAKRWTVANQTEGVVGAISNIMIQFVRDVPGFKFLLPAVRMPMGAFAQGLDWSPYGFLRAKAIKWSAGESTSVTNYIFNRDGAKKGWNLPAGGVTEERAIDLRTKAMIGTSLMIGLYLLTAADMDEDEDKADFYISGKGPENPAKNKLWREKGNRPFMIKLGPVKFNYQESPAFAPLAALGAWSDATRYGEMTDSTADRIAFAITKSMASFADAAVLKNLQDALGSATGGSYTSKGAVDSAGKWTSRLAGVVVAPRIGNEINTILFGPQDTKAIGWAGRALANVPFVPMINNKPALNFFGEEIHAERGGAMGEVLPFLAHRVSPMLTDDPQMQFVAKMGANPIKTGSRFKNGKEIMEDYDFVRQWSKESGKELRKWLTPQRMEAYNKKRLKDSKAAEKEFDSDVLELRTRILRRYKNVDF